MPASTQPVEGSSPGWKRFNNTYNSYERPCDCHEHDRGKCGERGGGVCSQGTAKAAGWSEEPWGEIFTVCNFVSLSPVSNLGGGVGQLFSALFANHGEGWRRG